MTILDDLKAAIEQTKPVQYYAINEALEPGKYFMFKGDWYWPETIFFNPADFEEKRAELSRYCRLVHLRDWMPTRGQVIRAWEEVIESLDEDTPVSLPNKAE